MNKKRSEIVGWYGVGAILLAYLLNSLGIINSSNYWYVILNLTGALGIVIDAWRQKNYQPVILNLVWAFIALFALLRMFLSF